MTWTTDCPALFSEFIREISMEKIMNNLHMYEKCHGNCKNEETDDEEEIKVVFFRKEDKPKGFVKQLPEGSTEYTPCIHYNFDDRAETRLWTRRYLLVTLA